MLRYPIATLLLLCLALAAIFMGCGDDEIIIQPADVTEQWLGAWRYMQDKDGVLVPDGDQKILFTPEGTYQLSHDDETGTYIVLEGSFHIDPTGLKTRTGSWVRNGDILKLVYEDKNIRILKKAVTFQKYTPPPPPPPRPTDHYPSATAATTFPATGSEVAPNMLLTITLNEAVHGVTVNRTAAAGSGRHWAINLAGLNLPPGSITLNIGWTNKNGTAGVGARVTLTILADADRTAPNIVSSSVLNRERDVEVAPLNANGIRIRFSEAVRQGEISITIEGGETLNWIAEWTDDAVTIVPARGSELVKETTYEIRVSVKDYAGNRLESPIKFRTEAE